MPNLSSDRVSYLTMLTRCIEIYVDVMREFQVGSGSGSLLERFIFLEIPDHIIGRCFHELEANLVQERESKLVSLCGKAEISGAMIRSSSAAVNLLLELWSALP